MSTTRLLNPATTEVLMPAFEAFIAALVEQIRPGQVIWFGSRARGKLQEAPPDLFAPPDFL